MSDNLAAMHAIIRGRVQGVFFRDATERSASALGLVGYVSNLPDGRSVEVRAEGDRDSLERLVAFLRVGPSRARVDEISVEWRTYSGSYADFSIR